MTDAVAVYSHGASARDPFSALVALVNDALASRVTRAGDGGANVMWTAVDAPRQARRPSPGGRAATGPGTPPRSGIPTEPDSREPDGPGDGGTPDVEDAHADVWRLVRLAQAGDGEAFGTLYDCYVDTVFRFIYYRVNDRQLAEDFTSETFLRALRRIGTISYQGRDIGAWFVTIARNIVLDHVKSARHRLEVTTADTLESREHEASTEATVLDTLQSEQLMAAIARLGEEQRECITLRFIQGLSVGETAAVMGKNDGAIKALQHRAVRKLADLVGGDLR